MLGLFPNKFGVPRPWSPHLLGQPAGGDMRQALAPSSGPSQMSRQRGGHWSPQLIGAVLVVVDTGRAGNGSPMVCGTALPCTWTGPDRPRRCAPRASPARTGARAAVGQCAASPPTGGSGSIPGKSPLCRATRARAGQCRICRPTKIPFRGQGVGVFRGSDLRLSVGRLLRWRSQ